MVADEKDQSKDAAQSALGALCSACGFPFGEHESRLAPTERGGFRATMTCPPEQVSPPAGGAS